MQSFWEHLESLRYSLLYILISLLVIGIPIFLVVPHIFDSIILGPCQSDFISYQLIESLNTFFPKISLNTSQFEVHLLNINMGTQFMTHITLSCLLAFLIDLPIIFYILWRFFEPALYPREKKSVRWCFFFSILQYYLGVLLGYFIVFPLTLHFLVDYEISKQILNQISLDSYMHNFYIIVIMMGLVFEMPLLSWLLGKVNIMKRSFFADYRRYSIVVLLILSAIITPTGDPFTLMIVFFPLYGLYELSAFFVPKNK